jgi:hypothetical protein
VRRLSLLCLIALSAVFAACEDGSDILVIDESGAVYLVETGADEGEGSLRAAIEAANTDPLVSTIQVEPGVETVALATSLTYTGTQALRIVGNGVAVDGSACACDLLVSIGGANLELVDLTLRNGEKGLYAIAPSSQSGTLEIRLSGVTVASNGLHGIHVDDGDSPAGIHLELVSSRILGNGGKQGVSDYDGVRVDEGNAGDLTFVARDTDAQGNDGDGIDLRETGTGDLFIDVRNADFSENGDQPQNLSAPEDGFDAREAGSGSMDVRLVSSVMSGNAASGIRLEEGGVGDFRGSMTDLTSSGNGGQNIWLSEDVDARGGAVPGAGGMSLTLSGLTVQNGDDDGALLEEIGAGDLTAQVQDSDFSGNEGHGLAAFQGGTGRGSLHLIRVTTEGNSGFPVETEGVSVTEGDDGTTTVLVRNSEDAGFGSLRAALESANQDDGITEILFESGVEAIEIESTLEYSGSQDLRVTAQGGLIDAGDCDGDALLISGSGNVVLQGVSIEDAAGDGLVVTGGGDLTLRNLILRNLEGNGLFVAVHEDAEGVVNLSLEQVLVENNGLHGVFIDDLAPVVGPGAGANSAAGVLLDVQGSTIQGNGFRVDVTDRDGIRVDEGGLGDIDVRLVGSLVLNNAGDGIQLAESGLGAVRVNIQGSQIDGNGRQPQNTDDPEDGLDVTEDGPGEVRIRVLESFVRNNYARGLGLEEEGSGGVSVTLETVTVTGNDEENITLTEDKDAKETLIEGSGSLTVSFIQVTATGAGADGIFMEEYGAGDLTGQVVDSSVRSNAGIGISATQAGLGEGQLQLVRVVFSGNTGGNLFTSGVGVATVPAG